MPNKVNKKGVNKAKSLIDQDKVNTNASWSFTAKDGNKLLGSDGDDWASYGAFHLGINPAAEKETKAYYKYPFGKDGEVYRSGLIAVRQRAGQQDDTAIFDMAGELLNLIDGEDANDGKWSDAEYEEKDYKMKKKKKDSNTEVFNRIDRIEAPYWMTDSFERTAEGFLAGRAVVTNVGVFEYQNPDGTIRRELRLPEEVFDYRSTETLKLKPVTNDHPMEIVTDKNYKNHQVGSTGSNPSSVSVGDAYYNDRVPYDKQTDGYHLAIDMVINDADAIEDVLDGKRELSCGYSVELEKADEGARWMGMPYDYIQRNIRYNHVAIVNEARAGDAARIRIDGATAMIDKPLSKIIKEDSNMALKKINIDGVEYEAEARVIELYNQAKNRIDTLTNELSEKEEAHKTDMSTLEAERDTANEKVQTLEDEVKQLKEDAADDDKIQARIDARILIVETAKKAKVEVNKDMSDSEIQKAVVKAVFPKANLDDKDQVYIDARFEAAVETLEVMDENDTNSNYLIQGDKLPNNDGSDEDDNVKLDSSKARENMIKRMHADSRGIENE